MTTMVSLRAATRAAARISNRRLLSTTKTPFFKPSLVETRPGEAGPSGRASEAGYKIAVFGASGFLGRYVCSELGSQGFMAYLGNRGCDMEMREYKTQFDLGRTRFVFYSPRDINSMKEVIADADVVVNLMGKYFESGQVIQTEKFPYLGWQTNFSYEDVNVKLARTLAEICYEMQVNHLIHVSSASASPTAKSEWSRTKYEGELAVKKAYPWATIIRPTQLYGREDRILNWFAFSQQKLRCVPLIYQDGGKEPLVQPVWVGDVARAIRYVCEAPHMFEGRQIDCFGPADFTYPELAKFVNDITEQNKPVLRIPVSMYEYLAKVLQLSRSPLMVPDMVKLWTEDFLPTLAPEEYEHQKDDANKILTLADLSIDARPIEKDAFSYLHYFRKYGHYHKTSGYHLNIPINENNNRDII